jgi:hypothetical protein
MLRTTQNLVVAQPNQAPARCRSDLAGRLVRLNGHLDQVLAIGVVALQAYDERQRPAPYARRSFVPNSLRTQLVEALSWASVAE